MASPLIIPFDNNPLSTTLKTTSYTVPSGKYALVLPISPFFTVNGVQVFPTRTIAIGNSGASTGTVTFTHSAKFYVTGQVTRNSDGGGQVLTGTINTGDRSQSIGKNAGTGTSLFTPWASIGTTLTVSATGGSVVSNSLITTCNIFWFEAMSGALWYPSGTVLNGSGYSVSEYNVVS